MPIEWVAITYHTGITFADSEAEDQVPFWQWDKLSPGN